MEDTVCYFCCHLSWLFHLPAFLRRHNPIPGLGRINISKYTQCFLISLWYLHNFVYLQHMNLKARIHFLSYKSSKHLNPAQVEGLNKSIFHIYVSNLLSFAFQLPWFLYTNCNGAIRQKGKPKKPNYIIFQNRKTVENELNQNLFNGLYYIQQKTLNHFVF